MLAQMLSHVSGYANLLRRIGSKKYLFYNRPQDVSLIRFVGVFTGLVGANRDDLIAGWDHHCGDIGLEQSKSLILIAGQGNGGPTG